jgi:streptogramin lyase
MVRNNRNLRLLVSVPLLLFMPFTFVVLLGGCGQPPPSGSSPTTSPVIKGTFTEYSLPMSGSSATSIVTGPDSNIWFTEVAATINGPISKIVRITPAGTISEFPQTPLKGNLFSITAGPDGNLWFADGGFSTGGKIGHITPTGAIKEFTLPASNGDPGGITAGPDGNLWFTFFSTSQNSKIERITPTGAIKEFSLPPTVAPGSITAGPDNNLWFTETIIGPKNVNVDNTVRRIGRITPTGTITEFPLTKGSSPGSITAGPDGNVWFTEDLNGGFSGSIARITPTGGISEFPLPTSNSSNGIGGIPTGIALGHDGALWFTDSRNNSIGRITPKGTISEFVLPSPQSSPDRITSGRDGKIWITEPGVNGNTGKIGRIVVSAVQPQ